MVVAADHALQVFPARVRGAAVDEIGPSDGRGVDGHRDMFHGVGAQSAGVFGSVFRSGLADREPDAAVTLHHGGLFRGVHPGVVGDRCRRAVKEVSGDFRRAVDAAVRDVAARIVERDGLLRTVVPRFAVAGSGLPDRRDVGELLSDQSFGAGVAERHGRRGAGEVGPRDGAVFQRRFVAVAVYGHRRRRTSENPSVIGDVADLGRPGALFDTGQLLFAVAVAGRNIVRGPVVAEPEPDRRDLLRHAGPPADDPVAAARERQLSGVFQNGKRSFGFGRIAVAAGAPEERGCKQYDGKQDVFFHAVTGWLGGQSRGFPPGTGSGFCHSAFIV